MKVKILLWEYTTGEKKLYNVVGKCIVYFTDSPYTHVALYVGGYTYDTTIWFEEGKPKTGIRKVRGQLKGTVVMVPNVPFSPAQAERLRGVADSYARKNKPYNIVKLLALAVVWNTRWFWKKIRWVPFNHTVFGEVCSGFVDEVFKKAGIDLFPSEYEGYTVPGQFIELRGWHKE